MAVSLKFWEKWGGGGATKGLCSRERVLGCGCLCEHHPDLRLPAQCTLPLTLVLAAERAGASAGDSISYFPRLWEGNDLTPLCFFPQWPTGKPRAPEVRPPTASGTYTDCPSRPQPLRG